MTKGESFFRLSVLGGFYLDGKLGIIQRTCTVHCVKKKIDLNVVFHRLSFPIKLSVTVSPCPMLSHSARWKKIIQKMQQKSNTLLSYSILKLINAKKATKAFYNLGQRFADFLQICKLYSEVIIIAGKATVKAFCETINR